MLYITINTHLKLNGIHSFLRFAYTYLPDIPNAIFDKSVLVYRLKIHSLFGWEHVHRIDVVGLNIHQGGGASRLYAPSIAIMVKRNENMW